MLTCVKDGNGVELSADLDREVRMVWRARRAKSSSDGIVLRAREDLNWKFELMYLNVSNPQNGNALWKRLCG